MEARRKGRLVGLSLAVIAGLALVPALLFGQQGKAAAAEGHAVSGQVAADAYKRDAEVVLINGNDGRIIIRDYAVGPNMVDLNGKYDAFGGPWYAVAAGDFDGDGIKELVAIGEGALGQPGPSLVTFDPVYYKLNGTGLTQLDVNVAPYQWLMVRCGDINGDGRDEIVALRSANEPGNINAHLVAYGFNPTTNAWSTLWDLPNGGGFNDISLGDFNGDGKADIAAARVYNYLLVLDGSNPNNAFFDCKFGGLNPWTKIRIGDLDGNGSADLALLRPQQAVSGNFPATILATHPISLNSSNDIYGWGFGDPPKDIQLADMNGDGKLEIVADSTGTFAKIYTLNPRMGGTNNDTETEMWIGDNEWQPNLGVGDVNGDGRPELMLVHNNGDKLRIYGFSSNSPYLDETTYASYSDNFIAVNLDGQGVSKNAAMSVPPRVDLFVDLANGNRATEALITVRNITNVGSFTWTATNNPAAAWLTMSATSGNANDTFTLGVNTAALTMTAGTNAQTTVAVHATPPAGQTVDNADQTIQVYVHVFAQLFQLDLPLAYR